MPRFSAADKDSGSSSGASVRPRNEGPSDSPGENARPPAGIKGTGSQRTPAFRRALKRRQRAIGMGVLAGTLLASSPWWLPALDRNLQLHRIHGLYATDPVAAQNRLELLHAQYPEHEGILFLLAQHNAEDPGGNRSAGTEQLISLVQRSPRRWRDNPTMLEHLKSALSRLELGGRDRHLRAFFLEHYALSLKPYLLEMVYKPGLDARLVRHNAFELLSASEAPELDPLRYFTLELFEEQVPDGRTLDRVLEFFEEQLAAGGRSALSDRARSFVPRPLTRIPVLEQPGPLAERAVPVLEAYFAEVIRPLLLASFSDPLRTGYRLYGWPIARARGWISPVLEWEYHRANLQDYDPGRADRWVLEAVEFYLEHANSGAWEALDALRPDIQRIADGTQEVLTLVAKTASVPASSGDAAPTLEDVTRLYAAADSLLVRIRLRRGALP